MSNWSSYNHPVEEKTWVRECGPSEAVCYWDGLFSGASDAAQHIQVDVAVPHLDLMEKDNVIRAWLAVKRRYPLLAARTVLDADDRVHFHVHESRTETLMDGEVEFGVFGSEAQIEEKIEYYLNGPRKLTGDLLGNIEVFSLQRGPHWSQSYWQRYHVFINTSHCVADGNANVNLVGTFFAMLTSLAQSKTSQSIEQRLNMVPSSESLCASPQTSLAKQRWQKAIASVLIKVWEGRAKVSFISKDSSWLVVDVAGLFRVVKRFRET